MLLLIFRSAANLYAVDSRRVAEVVPRVVLREIPHAPPYFTGMLGYRGSVVPVIDFGILTAGTPSSNSLSTRVILSEFTAHDGRSRLIGIVAEMVIQVMTIAPEQLVSAEMSLDEAPYLGAIARVEEGLVQLVEVGKLLSGRMQDSLYGSAAEPG